MKDPQTISTLAEYAESLVVPLRVLIVDTDRETYPRIVNALAPYNAEILNAFCACPATQCLQSMTAFDLIFIGVPLTQFGTPEAVIEEIHKNCPNASVVIMSHDPADECVRRLMELGPFTFLKKNKSGNSDVEQIRKIANQLNLKLRPSGKAVSENKNPATANVSRI